MRALLPLLMLTTLAATTSCTQMKHTLGFAQRSPDEYRIVTRPPLSIPPEYVLRPAVTGQGEAATYTADLQSAKARQMLIGDDVNTTTSTTAVSRGENVLLQRSGANNTDSSIRSILEQEAAAEAAKAKEKGFLGKLSDWKGEDKADEAIDPVAESERLKSVQ